jgi:hypothetical protein
MRACAVEWWVVSFVSFAADGGEADRECVLWVEKLVFAQPSDTKRGSSDMIGPN